MRPLALRSDDGRRPLGLLLAAALVLGLLATSLVAQPAVAAKKSKKKPHKVTVTAIATGSFTVQAKAWKAKTWRVFAATTKREVSLPRVRSAQSSPVSRNPRVTFAGLRPSSEPYYYRIAASDGTKTRYSTIQSVFLRPAVPSSVAVESTPAGGLAITWDQSGPAASFTVEQATDPAFTRVQRSYVVKGSAHELTPYGLEKGTEYWFRVRAANGPVASAYSSGASAVAPLRAVPVRVLSYNLLFAGTTKVGSTPASPWPKRRVAAAKLVDSAAPDVILAQEGNSQIYQGGPRQVDDFRGALGANYVVAGTEPDGVRTGPYVLYRPAKYTTVGAGGRWALGDDRYAAYQVLQDKASGARFLAVSVHLTSGDGAAKNEWREREVQSLIAQSGKYLAGLRAPVPMVVGGDFNSHAGKKYSFDPSTAFATEHVADTVDVATTRVNAKYNSANKYQRKPLTGSLNVDHIYAEPGVAVTKWSMLLDLDGKGQFAGVIPSDHNPIVADLEVPAPVSS